MQEQTVKYGNVHDPRNNTIMFTIRETFFRVPRLPQSAGLWNMGTIAQAPKWSSQNEWTEKRALYMPCD